MGLAIVRARSRLEACSAARKYKSTMHFIQLQSVYVQSTTYSYCHTMHVSCIPGLARPRKDPSRRAQPRYARPYFARVDCIWSAPSRWTPFVDTQETKTAKQQWEAVGAKQCPFVWALCRRRVWPIWSGQNIHCQYILLSPLQLQSPFSYSTHPCSALLQLYNSQHEASP